MVIGADVGEVYDMVYRKQPISHDGIMDQISTYSSDDVFGALMELEEDGYIKSRNGDLHEDRTTATVFYTDEETREY